MPVIIEKLYFCILAQYTEVLAKLNNLLGLDQASDVLHLKL